tara:strand:+ start:1407 stop:5153 length:3747 start_codon:yes stop_codon:yes gene_type:complete
MATTLTDTTFSSTYKDDFADSAGFHRILFNSGKALQARELTQLQTILQKQIQRFGDNIFKEGAVVKPGGPNLNQKYEFIKLDTTTNTLPTDTSTLIGTTITGVTSSIQAKILQVVEATGSDPATLYVQYINTSSGTSGTNTIRMTAGENLSGSTTLTVQTTNTTANPAVGVGILATLLSGVYYARGNFVFTDDQSKIISKYSDNVDTNIGFKVVEDVVTASDNSSLYDNQGAVPNVAAPGADRFRITLTIAEESDIDSDENFIHVATVKEGSIYNAVTVNDAYNIPNDVVAKRIFENSGDYIVKPYTIDFSLDSQNTHLLLNVSAGTAVVDGYRADRSFPSTLRVDKPTQTITINNDVIGVNYGNSVVVSPETDSATHGLPNINVFEKLTLKDGLDFTGSDLGTVRVKAINEDGANLRYHLFDLQLNSGAAFRNVKSIGTSTSSYFRPTLESSKAVLKNANQNTSLFKLSRARPKALTDLSLAVQRRFPVSSDVSGNASLSLSASGETFTNTSDWVIAKTDSDVFTGATISGAGSTSSTITGLPASSNFEILAYVNKGSAAIKTKTLATKSISISVDSDGNGLRQIPLFTADIFEVDEVLKAGDSNVSFADRFVLDNGQRDNHYGLGRLLLRAGQSAPSSNVFVKFKHFTHGVSGDFFAVNSYTGQVTYDKIPKYRFSNGTRIRLRDFADFRPVMDSGGEFAGAAARVIEQPQNGTLVTADAEYYLDRASKLVVDREGIIRLINGIPAFNPAIPEKPDQTLALYDIVLGGNTDNDSDLRITKIEHKRFTMKDIAQLEKRLANLEDVTTLNLLEVDTKHLQVLDSSGTDRTKSGFIVDNFSDHRQSLTEGAGYRAAIDPLQQELRPGFKEDNIRLVYDSAASTNTIRKGDNVYIEYDETPYINQNFASKSIRLNPFSVVIYEGLLTLSPSSDEWRDVDRRQDKIVQGGTRLSTVNAYNWNNWSWSWGGVSVENLQVGSTTQVQSGVVNRVVSEETVLDLIEDRVIQTAFLPFMRSRKVFFRAQGLRPNTRVFPFLDGNNISDFTRSETFQFYSDTDSDFGNTLKNTTAHPDGALNLTTDANGDISGSFIVPNNDTLKIRVGTKEFKLLDISADNEQNAACIAKTPYSATGFLDTKEATYASTRQLNVLGVNIRRRAIYQSDNSGDDPPPKTPTTITGSWITGPEALDNYGGHLGAKSLTMAGFYGNLQVAFSGGSIVGDDPSTDDNGGGHDGTDGGYGGADNTTDYGGT